MRTYVNKAVNGVSYDNLFLDCVIILNESHKPGDIVDDKIILTEAIFPDKIPTEEELDNMVYNKGYAVRAIRLEFIDDIITGTDLTPYGFTKVDTNRYCKSQEAIRWAMMEANINKMPTHKPTEKELSFWMD